MSWKAVAWANEQATESPSAHLVLLQLANIASEDGVVRRLDVDYLARVGKQSRASVFRRLREFEKAGVLTREVVAYTDVGAPIVGARLWLERTYCAMLSAHSEDPEEGAENEAAEGGGSVKLRLPAEGGVVSPRAPGSLTAETTSPYGTYPEDIKYPPTPQTESAERAKADEEENLDPWMLKFQASYPFDATMNLAKAREAAAALSIRDRARALRWASVYAADVKRRGATRPLDAARWLNQRRFDEVEKIAGGKARSIGLDRPPVYVVSGTPAWNAWTAYRGKTAPDYATGPDGRKNGWYFPSLWPPGVDPPANAGEDAA